MQHLPTIALVDKRGLVRDGLTQILKRGHLRNISSFSSVQELVDLGSESAPTLVVLGSGEPSDQTCNEVRACARAFPDARIVILADSNDPKHVLTAFKAGARAYLADVISGQALIRSLDLVVMGENLLSSTTFAKLFGLSEDPTGEAAGEQQAHRDGRSRRRQRRSGGRRPNCRRAKNTF